MNETSAHASLGARLREKLPEILIEAASVVVALLLALAANDWQEHRQMRERGDVARAAILAELRENRAEIENTRAKLKDILAQLRAESDKNATPPKELHVSLGLSLLSSAAWHAALATQSTEEINFAWTTRIAQIYELQETFQRVQGAVLDQLSTVPSGPGTGGREVVLSLLSRMDTLSQLADGLEREYADVLDAPAK